MPHTFAKLAATDTELRDEVTELLASYDDAGDEFLDHPDRETSALEAFDERNLDPLIGKFVGPYRIIEEIGQGGMGSVYKAERDDDAFKQGGRRKDHPARDEQRIHPAAVPP